MAFWKSRKNRREDDGAQATSLLAFLWFIVKVVAIVFAFRVFVYSAFYIPSESMVPTLLRGDYMMIAKWPYGVSKYSIPFATPLGEGRIAASLPERGDIVVFKHPLDKTDYIKRVIGLPGDTIAMREGRLILNGTLVERQKVADFIVTPGPYAGYARAQSRQNEAGEPEFSYIRYRETLPSGASYETLESGPSFADNFGPVTVDDGHIFVLGDHRDNSQDSRFPTRISGGVGQVPVKLLVGRADIIVFSTDGHAGWSDPQSWFTATRWNRIGQGL